MSCKININADNLSIIAQRTLAWEKRARGKNLFRGKNDYTESPRLAYKVNQEMEQALQNIRDLSRHPKNSFFPEEDKQIARVINKIATYALKDPENYKQKAEDAKGEEGYGRLKELSHLTGHYQAALEVIAAVSGILAPSVISAAANNLLRGTYQFNYNSAEDNKNQAMIKSGFTALEIVNREVKDTAIAKYLKQEQNPITIATIAGLNTFKETELPY